MEPDDDLWFDAAPLRGDAARRRLADIVTKRAGAWNPAVLAAFARANGMVVPDGTAVTHVNLGILYPEVCYQVLQVPGPPLVEFGNYGHTVEVFGPRLRPTRFGYVSIRHDLDLPHFVADHRGLGAKTVWNVTRFGLETAAFLTGNNKSTAVSNLSDFLFASARLDVDGVSGYAAAADATRARQLLTPPAVAELGSVTDSFVVEVQAGWLHAHSYFGDVSTTDAEIWAWVFSSTSRLLDLITHWSQRWPLLVDPGAAEVGPRDVRELPFYTERRVPRPAKLDGLLSPSRFSSRIRRS